MHHCSTYFIKNKGVFAPPMLSDSDFKLCYTIPYTLIINISRGQVPIQSTQKSQFFFSSQNVVDCQKWLSKFIQSIDIMTISCSHRDTGGVGSVYPALIGILGVGSVYPALIGTLGG